MFFFWITNRISRLQITNITEIKKNKCVNRSNVQTTVRLRKLASLVDVCRNPTKQKWREREREKIENEQHQQNNFSVFMVMYMMDRRLNIKIEQAGKIDKHSIWLYPNRKKKRKVFNLNFTHRFKIWINLIVHGFRWW